MRKSLLLCAAVLAPVLALSACSDPVQRASEYDYRTNHPLVVHSTTAELALEGPDHARIDAFAADYVARGHGVMQISMGAASAQDARARATLREIVEALHAAGLHVDEMQARLVVNDPALPVGHAHLSFSAMTAELPDCYDWRAGPPNGPSANYGCNMQRNIGAMVADPRDLLQKRADDSGFSGERADAVVGKYVKGEDTSAARMQIDVNTRQSSGQ